MKGNRKIGKNMRVKKNRGSSLASRIKYLIFIVFPVIALIVFVYFVSIAVEPVFHLKKVVFTGNEHLTDEELKDLVGLKGSENLIMISSSKIFEKMIESPWINSVSIRKEFPDELHILIRETKPFALLDIKGHLFIVDDRGKLLQELKSSPIPFLPVISGTPFEREKGFSEALALARVIKDKGFLFEKDHIEIIANKPQEMAVNLDGVVVKIGAGDYEDKLLRLMDLEEEIRERNIQVDYIDLRFANRAVVKPMNEVIH